MTIRTRSRRLHAPILASLALVLATIEPVAQTADFSVEQWGSSKAKVGCTVSGAGDLDGDGWPDFVAGGYGITSGFAFPGNVLAVSGRDGRLLHAFSANTSIETVYFGARHVSGAGDADGDGFDDFVFDAESAAGEGYHVISGRDGSVLLVLPSLSGDLEPLGDLDGDAHDDLLVGELDSLTVFSGSNGAVLRHVLSDLPGQLSYFAYEVAAAGDVDADGIVDLAFRGWDQDQPNGPRQYFLRVQSGADGSRLLDVSDPAIAPFMTVGFPNPTLAAYGDLDLDGHDDLLVSTTVDAASPAALIVSGADGSILRAFTDPEFEFSGSVAVPGDLDADGMFDVLAGTFDAVGASNAGRVTLFSGATGAILSSFQSAAPTHGFGSTLDALGDVTGDGVPDFLVGAGGISHFVGVASVRVYSGAGSPVSDLLGAGAEFQAAIGPVLTLRSTYQPLAKTTLALRNGPLSAPMFLVVGTATTGSPGFDISPVPGLVLPLVLDGSGAATLTMRWPAPSPIAPTELFVQVRSLEQIVSNVLAVTLP